MPYQLKSISYHFSRAGPRQGRHDGCCATLRRNSAVPPTNCWLIDPGLKAARTPNMRGRVNEPRRVKTHDGAQENTPQQEGQSADSEKHEPEDNRWHKMVFRDPDVKLVLRQVGDVAVEGRSVLAQSIANQNPAHMRPPLAIARRVRVAFLIRELMMNTMRGHPQERPPSTASRRKS